MEKGETGNKKIKTFEYTHIQVESLETGTKTDTMGQLMKAKLTFELGPET